MSHEGIKLIFGLVGAGISFVFGNLDLMIMVLCGCMIVDYITGVLAGMATQTLSSKIGFIGIARKVVILCIVAVAHWLDLILGSGCMLRNATIFFYIANEILSLFENATKMKVGIPAKIRKTIQKFLKDNE